MIGSPSPDFKAQATNDKIVQLKDYRGKWIVLYFYPKAFTPGCTKEACSLRNGFQELTRQGVVVLGVSLDNLETQKKFKAEHHLPFELIADDDKKVASLYGTLGLLNLYTKRKTFIIDPQGKLAGIIDKVDSADHDRQVLEAVQSLSH